MGMGCLQLAAATIATTAAAFTSSTRAEHATLGVRT
jgi:hypothetical protein